MDLGLYNLKYPVRRALQGLLPRFRTTDPNTITWSVLPVGVATAACAWAGLRGANEAWAGAIALAFLRMFLTTLDGLVAQSYGRETRTGSLLNRVVPELCDVLLVGTLAATRPEWAWWGVAALAAGWLVTFAGLVGATVGLPPQSVGPVGQTDRLAAFQVAALVAAFEPMDGWSVQPMLVFLVWCACGGALTVVMRLRRHFRGARGGA